MQYISLSNNSLTYFTTKAPLSQLGGSSRYKVYDNQIVKPKKKESQKIENTRATQDYLNQVINANMSESVIKRIKLNYLNLLIKCTEHKFSSERELTRLELLKEVLDKALLFGNEMPLKQALIRENVDQSMSRYQHILRSKLTEYRMNKSKVRQKMFALFNLKCSSKFIAFYSVSFPVNSADNECFKCWDYWLTCLRKNFDLTNYIWVSERQKNGTLHYHMLTNNYMPILQINRAMAIIIDNQVKDNLMNWGGAS